MILRSIRYKSKRSMTGHGITIVFQVIGLLTALRTTSGKRFTVVSTGSPVPATLGNDSYLCCRLEPEISAENMTIKFHVGDYNICLYKNGKEDLSNQNETYKDRVELLTENITVGQVTLWIKNIQQSDTGNYTCTFVSDDFSSIATMELHVNKRFEVKATEKTVIATNGGAADLGCHLDPENSAELMTIKFHRGDPKSYVYVYNKNPADSGTQNETYKDRTELLTENITRGQVTLRIKNVQLSDIGNYTCVFASSGHYDTGIVELLVADSENVIPIAAGITVPALLLVGAAGAAGGIYKNKQGKGSETQEIQREIETSKNDTCAVEMKPLNEAE